MKICSALFCLLLMMSSTFSFAAPEKKNGLLVKVDFQFQDSKKSFQVKYDSILSEDNVSWTPLGPAQAGVALLGKVNKQKKDILTIEYMVIDTSATPIALHQMSVISRLGQSSNISFDSDKEKISIGLVAEAATYTEKSDSN